MGYQPERRDIRGRRGISLGERRYRREVRDIARIEKISAAGA
ncbi:hypothetical protein ACFOGI_06905 [Virgibacillus xinjiangensis]|uniref:Uncharacterized protein n=1 Tax=Virgibacillus xinjiangensis TaxID=393090 RepID=A0ABV7CUA0_9BACI